MITETRTTEIDGVPIVTVVSDANDNDSALIEMKNFARSHHFVWTGDNDVDVEQKNGHRLFSKRLYSNDAVVALGRSIYKRDIKAAVENDNIGRVIAIDVESGKFALGDDEFEAVDRLRAAGGGRVVFANRVGYKAMTAVGASIPRDTDK